MEGRPNRFRIYAPNGHSEEVVGWLALGYKPPPDEEVAGSFAERRDEVERRERELAARIERAKKAVGRRERDDDANS